MAAPNHSRAVAIAIVAGVEIAIVSSTSKSPAITFSTKENDKQANTTTVDTNGALKDGTVCDTVKQDAGYITLPNKKDGHYFYWYFESRNKPSEDPLVLWLTSGPGCSSLWAMLAENGPCVVQKDLSTKLNKYSWTTSANVLWLDQPLFTGFSYDDASVDGDSSGVDVRENLYLILEGFFARHPVHHG